VSNVVCILFIFITHAQVRQQKMSRNFQVHQVGQTHREEEMDSNVGWLLYLFFYYIITTTAQVQVIHGCCEDDQQKQQQGWRHTSSDQGQRNLHRSDATKKVPQL
jgi:hypothetical protein